MSVEVPLLIWLFIFLHCHGTPNKSFPFIDGFHDIRGHPTSSAVKMHTTPSTAPLLDASIMQHHFQN